ncbi:MAG: acetyl-CoA carboxylase carboxyltransferase subunit alpha [Acidobacteriota bacterium]|nr:acetyl-CoA carboxylase carboxyltransferase subunit alpha [Acidobacteriota bacterium]
MINRNKNAFERVQLARHPERPYTSDLLKTIFTDFVEMHGDRRYADDAALICGFATLDSREVAIVGHQKGRDTNQRKLRNFGMPMPEGYRKALRVMKFAEKFNRPIITFIDTPGAYPGVDAEERGQAEAIAFNLREMASLTVPVIGVILGEGGSGGALAIGVADRILMLENAVYSVITPEGCAAILWKDAGQAGQAAESLKLTADELKKNNLIDEIIPESSNWKYPKIKTSKSTDEFHETVEEIKKALNRNLEILDQIDFVQRIRLKFEKFRIMGNYLS